MTSYRRRALPTILIDQKSGYRKLDEDILRYLNEQDEALDAVLRRGISFADNFNSVYVQFTSHATPDTEFTVSHSLGRIPTGYIPITKDKAADVYNVSAPTATSLLLKCNASSATIKMLVF